MSESSGHNQRFATSAYLQFAKTWGPGDREPNGTEWGREPIICFDTPPRFLTLAELETIVAAMKSGRAPTLY